jgi:hypothetical protein
MDFHCTHVFSMKKVDKSANFAAGGIINHRIHHKTDVTFQIAHVLTILHTTFTDVNL